jgi:zinc protease
MKNLFYLLISLLISPLLYAQSPLEVEQFTLENGLTVYLNSDTTANQVFGAVVVKAGSMNDPADATGIAHYLEHLLFKGTDRLGTSNFKLEKPHLDSITRLYEQLAGASGKDQRTQLQSLINEQSVLAAQYGLPNEFDDLIKSIGGSGVNAFTTSDMTVYHNGFPAEQMDKWLQLYSERFTNPIFRSFQSELEVVYEEKNRSMDAMENKLFELINENLFKYHPYGTQTTLGKVEHLKRPSLNKMYAFFDTYYVANNMALVLCGNFDIEAIKPMIEQHFSKLQTGKLPEKISYPKTIFTKNEMVKVKRSPIKLEVIGFKSIPSVHPDRAALDVVLELLFNSGETGALDKLVLDHKLMLANGFDHSYNEDGAVLIIVVPKLVGQSFKKAEKLVYDEINKIRKGEVSDESLRIVKTGLYRQHQQSLENYRRRTMNIVRTFSTNTSWDSYLTYSDKINLVTKEDVIRVAEKYFGAPHFTLRSRRGDPDKTVLDKPNFKPVIPKEGVVSEYAQAFKSNKIPAASPKFIDVEKDAERISLNESNILYCAKNPINDVFSLTVGFWVGTDRIKNLEKALDLFTYFHTSDLNLEQLKREFAKIGLTYYNYASRNMVTISFSGLESNLEESIKLINKLIYSPVADESLMKILKEGVKANLKFEKKDPSTIGSALFEYATYGDKSGYLNRTSLKQIKRLKAHDLVQDYKKGISHNAIWLFVGKTPGDSVGNLLRSTLQLANNKIQYLPTRRELPEIKQNLVYVTHNKKAVQSHVNFIIPSKKHQYSFENRAKINGFNRYIGGGFSGIILQEVREFRSLAYSAGGYMVSSHLPKEQAYFRSYIGCQADKTNKAIAVMMDILDSLPLKPDRVESIRTGLKNNASNRYPSFRYLPRTIAFTETYGSTYIMTPEEYKLYDSLKFSDITNTYKEFVQGRAKIITVSGNTSKIDSVDLKKYGDVIYVKKKKLFTK